MAIHRQTDLPLGLLQDAQEEELQVPTTNALPAVNPGTGEKIPLVQQINKAPKMAAASGSGDEKC